MKEVEINQIDLRYEEFRLKNSSQEKILLNSILEQGLREPLQCVMADEKPLILLDGFKRLRCCLKLGIGIVPVVSLGEDEASGILQLIRLSNNRSLNILEQAALVDRLNRGYNMTIYEIARHLERSPAWVSVRLGIIDEMRPVIKEAVFSGRFPVRSYMYTLRQFTRVNKKTEIDSFVKSVSGKGLSTREIETLAYGFFRGGIHLKEQIQQGDLGWTLRQMSRCEPSLEGSSFSELEKRIINNLELVQKYIKRLTCEINDPRLKTPSFFTIVQLLTKGILENLDFFKTSLEKFYGKPR